MKKPGRKLIYGAGMLAMAMSFTGCTKVEQNATVYGPPEYFTSNDANSSSEISVRPRNTIGDKTGPEDNGDVYGPPPDFDPEDNGNVYGPPPVPDPESNVAVYGPPPEFLADNAPVQAIGEDDYQGEDYTEELTIGKGDSYYGVIFMTDRPVTDFSILSLEVKDISQDGTIEWDFKEEYTREELLPGDVLAVYLTFYGSIPNNGISYVDDNGVLHYFTLSASGKDGTIILEEF